MTVQDITRDYFKNFESMNLSELSDMFNEEVTLKDWNIEVSGKQSVVEANESIFNSVENIKVAVDNLYISGQTAIAQLSIYINEEPALPVVDIINFDEQNLITSITAYRGN